MWAVEFKGHAGHGNDRDVPARQLVERIQKVLRRAALPAEFCHQHRIDLARLRQGHHLVAGVTVGLGARDRLFVDAQNIVPGASGEIGQISDLPFTGLVGCRDPRIDHGSLRRSGCFLSQLNWCGLSGHNGLFLLDQLLSLLVI